MYTRTRVYIYTYVYEDSRTGEERRTSVYIKKGEREREGHTRSLPLAVFHAASELRADLYERCTCARARESSTVSVKSIIGRNVVRD